MPLGNVIGDEGGAIADGRRSARSEGAYGWSQINPLILKNNMSVILSAAKDLLALEQLL
ncbi:hypothetical protein ACFST9_23840 [Hymenobacter monticola]